MFVSNSFQGHFISSVIPYSDKNEIRRVHFRQFQFPLFHLVKHFPLWNVLPVLVQERLHKMVLCLSALCKIMKNAFITANILTGKMEIIRSPYHFTFTWKKRCSTQTYPRLKWMNPYKSREKRDKKKKKPRKRHSQITTSKGISPKHTTLKGKKKKKRKKKIEHLQ